MVFEILEETWCECLSLLTNMSLKCKNESDGVSTWSKLYGRTYKHYPVMCRSLHLPIVMYCEVCCCLHVKCSVYKHLNTYVHFGPSKPRCL